MVTRQSEVLHLSNICSAQVVHRWWPQTIEVSNVTSGLSAQPQQAHAVVVLMLPERGLAPRAFERILWQIFDGQNAHELESESLVKLLSTLLIWCHCEACVTVWCFKDGIVSVTFPSQRRVASLTLALAQCPPRLLLLIPPPPPTDPGPMCRPCAELADL